MKLPASVTTVTTFLKTFALLTLILIIAFGFYVGIKHQQSITPINSQPTVLTLTPSSPTKPVDTNNEPCVKAGCSGQLCLSASKAKDMITTCEYKDEYACYQKTACERQANGTCGWTETPEFNECMKLNKSN